MAALEAIIFDVDGTLAETEEVHRAAFNRAFAEAGLGWHWDEALYGELLKVAGGKERLAHYAATIDVTLPVEEIARLHARKTDHYVGAMAAGEARLRLGVERLIGEAQERGIRLAIATTTTRANVDILLGQTLGSTAMFEAILAGDDVPAKKPAPDVYLAVLGALDLPAASCLAIEDSPDGLRAARGAGIDTIVTPSRYMAGGDFSGAWRVLTDLAATDLAEIASARNGARI